MNQTLDQLHTDLMKDTVAFPVLSADELEECAEFGTRCSFAAGEVMRAARSGPDGPIGAFTRWEIQRFGGDARLAHLIEDHLWIQLDYGSRSTFRNRVGCTLK